MGTMRRLVKYLRPFIVSIIIVFVFAIASTVFAIMSPKILGNATNQIVSDYINIKAYDQITASLPKGTVIPPGQRVPCFLTKSHNNSFRKCRQMLLMRLSHLIYRIVPR